MHILNTITFFKKCNDCVVILLDLNLYQNLFISSKIIFLMAVLIIFKGLIRLRIIILEEVIVRRVEF